MKKILGLLLIVFFISSLTAATRYQLKEYPFYSGINVNMFRLSGNGAPGSLARFNFGARLGYNYTQNFAFEIAGNYGKTVPSDPDATGFTAWTTASEVDDTESTFSDINLAMRYNFLPKLASNPYLYLGLGDLFWSCVDNAGTPYEVKNGNDSNIYAFFGVGLENRISQHFSINLNFKQSLIFGDTKNMLGDEKSPDKFTQFGLELIVKFGAGVIERVNLEDIEAVTFEFNSIKITKDSEKIIDYITEAMKKNPDLVLEVRGFTDNTGSDSVNLRMSKKRSMAVKQLLVDRGISPTRIITSAMGHQNPVATNSTPEGRALNRRVEFYELQK